MALELVLPNQWGARVDYTQWTDTPILKDKIVIHHAGTEQHARGHDQGKDREIALLRSYERSHLEDRRWRGLAYGFAIGHSGTVYSVRGWNRYAGHAGDLDRDGISENSEGIPVLFIQGGAHATSEAALDAFRLLHRDLSVDDRSAGADLPVFGHRDISGTECPGDFLYGRIQEGFWKDPVVDETPIIGRTAASQAAARTWASNLSAHERFVDVASVYWTEAPRLGVRADVAYAQAAKETGFGHFRGVVTPDMHNWCGLKIRNPQGATRADHATFPSDTVGVRAHLQHLALYAGMTIPPANVVDPRHFASIRGTATTVEGLGGRWAPSPTYGVEIVNNLLGPMTGSVASSSELERTVQDLVQKLAQIRAILDT